MRALFVFVLLLPAMPAIFSVAVVSSKYLDCNSNSFQLKKKKEREKKQLQVLSLKKRKKYRFKYSVAAQIRMCNRVL